MEKGGPIPLNLGTQSNPGIDPHAGVARLINCYAISAGKEGKQPVNLTAIPGLGSWSPTSGGGCRALIPLGNTLYAVCGRSVYALDTAGTATLIGAIPSTGFVSWSMNRQQPYQQIMISCDGLSFVLQNRVLTQISNENLGPAFANAFMDGFSIAALSGQLGKFQWSSPDEATEWNALDFATAEKNADGLMGIGVAGNVLTLIGERSTEFFQNTGNADNQFVRMNATGTGCIAKRSVRSVTILRPDLITDTLMWVAADKDGSPAGVIMQADYTAKKVSPEALDRVIEAEPDKASISATSYVDRGHGFYVLSGTDWTWVYDTATDLWHERSSSGGRWRVSHICQFGGMLIAGDATTGELYRMRHDIYEEDGEPLVVTVQVPPLHAYPERIEYSRVWLDVVPGVGLNGRPWGGADSTEVTADESIPTADETLPSGYQNTYPQIMMRYSHDGVTWSAERRSSIGRHGQRQTRVYWNRLGTAPSHGRTYQFRASAAVLKTFLGAFWEGRKLRA